MELLEVLNFLFQFDDVLVLVVLLLVGDFLLPGKFSF